MLLTWQSCCDGCSSFTYLLCLLLLFYFYCTVSHETQAAPLHSQYPWAGFVSQTTEDTIKMLLLHRLAFLSAACALVSSLITHH